MSSIRPGDILECLDTFHWAIYIGDDAIVHLCLEDGRQMTSSGSFNSILATEALVKKSSLSKSRKNYKVNNLYDHKYNPLPPDKIVKQALNMVGKRVPYDVVTQNCKNFVVFLRYGKKCLKKNWKLKVFGAAIVIGLIILL